MNFYDLNKDVQETMLEQLKKEVVELLDLGLIEIPEPLQRTKAIIEYATVMAESISFTKEEIEKLNNPQLLLGI